jgi:hypothetical protein
MAVAMRNAAGMRSAAYTLTGAGGLGRGDDEATDRSCAVDEHPAPGELARPVHSRERLVGWKRA